MIALLTILGYSLYDTVVVFDKVRENTGPLTAMSRTTYSQATNLAVNQTMMRSLNTSLASLLPILGLLLVGNYLLGAETLKDLALALFIGVAAGAYSSIFIAPPLVAMWKEKEPRYAQLRARVERLAARAPPPSGPSGPERPVRAGARRRLPPPPERELPALPPDAELAEEPALAADPTTSRSRSGPWSRAADPTPAQKHARPSSGASRPGASSPARPSAAGASPDRRTARAHRHPAPAGAHPRRARLQPGIVFKDITPLLADEVGFSSVIDETVVHFGRGNVDKVVGIEARGFILASPVAYHFEAGFVPVRKAGKLPYQVEAEVRARVRHRHPRAARRRDRPRRAGPDRRRRARHRRHRPGRGPAGRAPGRQGHRHRHPDRARVPRGQEADRGCEFFSLVRYWDGGDPEAARSRSTSWSRSPRDPQQVRARPRDGPHPPRPDAVQPGPLPDRLRLRARHPGRGRRPWTPWSCWASRPSPAARSRPASSACSTWPTTRARTRSCWSSPDRPHWNYIHEIDQVPHLLREIEHFFSVYKTLEDKTVETFGWRDAYVGRHPRPGPSAALRTGRLATAGVPWEPRLVTAGRPRRPGGNGRPTWVGPMAQQHPTAVPDGLALDREPQPGSGAAAENGAAAGAVTRPMTPGSPPEPDVEPLLKRVRQRNPGPTPPPSAGPSSWPGSATPAGAGPRASPLAHPSGWPRSWPTWAWTPSRSRRPCSTTRSRRAAHPGGDRHQFGPEVAKISDGLVKLDRIGFEGREAAQAEIIRKMVIAMARDIRVLVIKLADRLHNMRDIGYLDREAQERKAREVLEIYAPWPTGSASTRSSGSWRTWPSRPCTRCGTRRSPA